MRAMQLKGYLSETLDFVHCHHPTVADYNYTFTREEDLLTSSNK